MTLPVWQGLAAQESSSDIVVLASPSVTVTEKATGGQPNLFSDRAGSTGIGNPFTANADGSIEFYVAPGRYKVEATKGGQTVTWDNQLIGTDHGIDQPSDNDLKYYDDSNDRWARLAMAASRVLGMLTGGVPKALTPQETTTVQVVTVSGNSGSPQDDAYTADLEGDLTGDETFRGRIANANVTTTPTLENTGGTPGALTVTTRDGSALWAGALSGDHTFQYDADSSPDTWLVLDPNPVAANSANAPVSRDSNGRFKAADPSAAQDVVTKTWGESNLLGARIATGTYTGDGSTSQGITGVGFQPVYVKIWERQTADAASVGIFETTDTIIDDNASGASVFHAGGGGHTLQDNTIISLDADGFTVDDNGADNNPNKNGTTYNYMAIG